MAKIPQNNGKTWTAQDIAKLKNEVLNNTPTRLLALHLSRTESSIYAKASELGISLKPVNQSPYGTKKP